MNEFVCYAVIAILGVILVLNIIRSRSLTLNGTMILFALLACAVVAFARYYNISGALVPLMLAIVAGQCALIAMYIKKNQYRH